MLADDISRRHRQGPTVFTVELGQVGAECPMHFAQVLGQGPADAETRRNLARQIAHDRETQAILPLGLAAVGGGLLRNGDQAGTPRLDPGADRFERLQVEAAIGTPAPTIERHHQRPPDQQNFGRDQVAARLAGYAGTILPAGALTDLRLQAAGWTEATAVSASWSALAACEMDA